jgi:hypothetical protein
MLGLRRSRGSVLALVAMAAGLMAFTLYMKRIHSCPPPVESAAATNGTEIKRLQRELNDAHNRLQEAARGRPEHPDADAEHQAAVADTTKKAVIKEPAPARGHPELGRGYEKYDKYDEEVDKDEWAEGKGSARLYCLVPFVWIPSKKDSHAEIMRTWGRRCDGINFFVDNTHLDKSITLPENVIVVNMTRKSVWGDQSQKHIWEKMWRSWLWVHDNKLTQYDWFLKVDDDNFFFPENVRRFVRQKRWKPTDAHYFGHKLYHRINPLIAGALVGFSRGTLGQLAGVYRTMPMGGVTDERGKCEDRKGATEELSTAICLYSIGIHAEDTRDRGEHNGAEKIMIFQPAAHFLHMKRPPKDDPAEGWYWQNKPQDYSGDLVDCCSRVPMAFHGFKGKGSLDHLNDGFYGAAGIKGIDGWLNMEHDAQLTQYWTDVRKNLAEEPQHGDSKAIKG